ncbi:hypothetical protein Bca4012_045265 [Brassica carinata]
MDSGDLWMFLDNNDTVNPCAIVRENQRRLFVYIEKLPLVVPDQALVSSPYYYHMSSVSAVTDEDKQVYVVYMGSLPSRLEYTPMSHHMSILQEVTGESSIEGRLVRSYKRSFNGFAARLTESEMERVAKLDGVVSVFPSKMYKIQTTGSWNFMGLKDGKDTKRNLGVESNTIIGVIDTGVWPESESFSDKGFGPPPKKWKGQVDRGKRLHRRRCKGHYWTRYTYSVHRGWKRCCGHKLLWNRQRNGERCRSTASRIAVYKVCLRKGCTSEAILSAFDDAIADGVDLITLSLDGYITSFEQEPNSIGAFHAMAKGVLTVNSADNSGPTPASVSSVAPWIFTVAASNTNRGFVNKVLGNGKTIEDSSVPLFLIGQISECF